ncbi:hypothetical protein [Vibrio panuliri]|uniref:Uncharacterized protein n=1 Tax=Vibrio panuliri TaxID=1381081 RepID=A0A1Q9HNF6_9VIBR|nr:hypothetical protein [Vibrio panuliri]KAB1457713.1 hypothetical protein F7O85_08230 [Vibrio panuliri]OLQ85803.1 hypothetical protein BIY20_03155 [Vibrio panuliri]OLQ92356.1 hypothetical protein BIY22_16220 [Vibrio panuliri]
MIKTLAIFALGVATNVYAYGDIHNIENCAKLLPEGHQYTVSIQVSVDKTQTPSLFKGDFSVDGNVDQAQQFDIEPFVECVGPLIKVEVEPISEEEQLEALKPLFQGIVY